MAFTVSGYVDGVSYAATVDGEPDGTATGVVSGTPNVVTLLRAQEGQPFSPTATSQSTDLDLNDPTSVLIALRNLTQVTSETGEVPEIDDDPFDPSVIY